MLYVHKPIWFKSSGLRGICRYICIYTYICMHKCPDLIRKSYAGLYRVWAYLISGCLVAKLRVSRAKTLNPNPHA